MQAPKVALSDAERRLVCDPEIILTKNRIIEKVYTLLGDAATGYRSLTENWREAWPEVFAIPPKISRGEQYHGLPWVMLDYPRYFRDDDGYFAVRTFFGWGRQFTLQALYSGNCWHRLFDAGARVPAGWMAGVTGDPWNHYLPHEEVSAISAGGSLPEPVPGRYFKTGVALPLQEWDNAPAWLQLQFAGLVTSWGEPGV